MLGLRLRLQPSSDALSGKDDAHRPLVLPEGGGQWWRVRACTHHLDGDAVCIGPITCVNGWACVVMADALHVDTSQWVISLDEAPIAQAPRTPFRTRSNSQARLCSAQRVSDRYASETLCWPDAVVAAAFASASLCLTPS